MNPLSSVYGQVARFRRRWYTRRPHLRRQLQSPVVSVGNLVVGGSGKTPVVAAIALMLRDAGYRPAILSRGYKRRGTEDIAIVSDGQAVLADVATTGDEPQMLARRLPGVPIVVCRDRHRAGEVAQRRLGGRVLILDDGFQHLQMARTVNLLMLSNDDTREQVLPAGRLREPLDAAAAADAILVPEGEGDPRALAERVGVRQSFSVHVRYAPLCMVRPYGGTVEQRPHRVVTLTGIARPQRFTAAVRRLGFDVREEIAYRDHHWFTPADIARIDGVAQAAEAEAILTTEKDAVRLEGMTAGTVPMMFLPIDAQIEPPDAFRTWLFERLGSPEPRS